MGRTIADRELEALLEAQTSLRRVAEERERATRMQLERVAERLCPEALNRVRLQDPAGTNGMEVEEVADLVIGEVGQRLTRLDAAEATGRSVADMLVEAQAEVERLRNEVLQLRRDVARAEGQARQAETRATVLEGLGGSSVTPVLAPLGPEVVDGEPVVGSPAGMWDVELTIPEEQLPAWMQEWLAEAARRGTRERDLVVLRILGETGVARRTEAKVLFARAVGLDPAAGSAERVFRRAQERGLLEVVEAQTGVRGQAHLLRLTRQGEDTYRLLFGAEPARAQTTELLNRHKSPEHAMLILAAGDVLEEAGWRVDLLPEQVGLDGSGIYEPDLAAIAPDGRPAYVECERRTAKKPEERRAKWSRYFEASGGDLHVAVPDQEALQAIRSEVLFWLGERRFRLRMMVVNDARSDDLWAYTREQRWDR